MDMLTVLEGKDPNKVRGYSPLLTAAAISTAACRSRRC